MQRDSDTPAAPLEADRRTLWAAALRHDVDPRSVAKALRGQPVKGIAGKRARAAADEVRRELAGNDPPPRAA